MKITIRAIITLCTLALFLGACSPIAASNQQNPQVQNTQSGLDMQSQINTSVAQTIEAQNQIGTFVAQTIEAQATATATSTPINFPTLTPFVITTPTNKPSSGSGSGTGAKPRYSCDIIRLRPTAYAEYIRGQKFDIKMTVVNNGTSTWPSAFDLKYSGGPKMTTTTRVEIPALKPGAQYEVVFDAVAPSDTGNQTMTWMVEGQLCYGYVTINVVK